MDDEAVANKEGNDVITLLGWWQLWLSQFPDDFKMVTIATDPNRDYVQVRFWFGEPRRIYRGHADSAGHNLIVHISGPYGEESLYKLLCNHMVGDLQFTKKLVDGVEVWRRKPSRPA
jgi:hypothetical protein